MKNFNNYLFRCSSLGKLMTDPRAKSETLAETTKTYLNEIFLQEVYKRKKDISNKYMEKGLLCEEDSLNLYSEMNNIFTIKNKEKFSNDYIIGTPDILGTNNVDDIKTSWNLFTFFDAEVTKDYDWQLEGYSILTGKEIKRLVYVLVNSPANLITDEKRRLGWQLNDLEGTSKLFIEKAQQIERNMIFDLSEFKKENPFFEMHTPDADWNFDIEKSKRIKIFNVEKKTDEERNKLFNRITESRNYLNLLMKTN
jgi:hypothetical protein